METAKLKPSKLGFQLSVLCIMIFMMYNTFSKKTKRLYTTQLNKLRGTVRASKVTRSTANGTRNDDKF